MFDIATGGYLDQSAYIPDRSVAVQQIFSTLYQHRGNGMSEQALVPVLQELLSPQEVVALLSHLVLRGSLERRGSHVFLTTAVLDEAERGQIHTRRSVGHGFRAAPSVASDVQQPEL